MFIKIEKHKVDIFIFVIHLFDGFRSLLIMVDQLMLVDVGVHKVGLFRSIQFKPVFVFRVKVIMRVLFHIVVRFIQLLRVLSDGD